MARASAARHARRARLRAVATNGCRRMQSRLARPAPPGTPSRRETCRFWQTWRARRWQRPRGRRPCASGAPDAWGCRPAPGRARTRQTPTLGAQILHLGTRWTSWRGGGLSASRIKYHMHLPIPTRSTSRAGHGRQPVRSHRPRPQVIPLWRAPLGSGKGCRFSCDPSCSGFAPLLRARATLRRFRPGWRGDWSTTDALAAPGPAGGAGNARRSPRG